MQSVLWGVLCATVGLAALVNHQVRLAMAVRLGDPISLHGLTVRLPLDWKRENEATTSAVTLIAHEPIKYGRALMVTLQRLPERTSVEEYLSAQYGASSDAREVTETRRSISILDRPGLLTAVTHHMMVGQGERAGSIQMKTVLAAAVFPTGNAVLIRLDGLHDLNPTDFQIVEDVAAAIAAEETTAESTNGTGALRFPGGMEIQPPPAFSILPEQDPLVHERRFVLRDGPMRDATGVIVPVIFFPDAAEDAVRGLLISRDARWAGANVESMDEGLWRIERIGESSQSTAYLHAHEDGRGVLAIFHGGADRDAVFAAWESIVEGLSFTGDFDHRAHLQAGAAQAASLREEGLDELIPESSADEWWEWTRTAPEAIVGWTRNQYDPAKPRHVLRESRWLVSGQNVMQLVEEAETPADLSGHECLAERSHADIRSGGGFDRIVSRQVDLRDGHLSIITSTENGRITFNGAAPPSFVPGAWLPVLLGRMEPRAMILISDSLPGWEDVNFIEPLVIFIEPTEEHPRTLAAEGAPMRCLKLSINGTGVASRWYFNQNGGLECIDLPGGVTRLRCEESKVYFDFETIDQMTPPKRTY